MEMHQIQYFLAVARALNFTRAAEELQIGQPSLTKAIHKLEAELGGALFRRERMNTHLTELGRLVAPDLEAVLAASEAAKARARRLKADESGSLTLGVARGLDSDGVVACVLDVAQRLRGVDVTVEVAHADAVGRALIRGDFDAAILGAEGDAIERLNLAPIETDAPVVAFAGAHRFGTGARLELREIDAEPLAVRQDGWADAALATAMEAHGLSRLVRYRSNDPRWIAEIVRRGLAVAAMPQAAALSFGLSHRAFADGAGRTRTVLATVAGRQHSRAVAMLVQRIKKSGAPASARASDVCEAS